MAINGIEFAFPGIPDVRCFFQNRLGGESTGAFMASNISLDVGDNPKHVVYNRLQLQKQLELNSWCELKQVHGDTLLFDPSETPAGEPAINEADGSATDKAGKALVIKTADCQPILLAHKSGQYIAALHAGWRGNRIAFPISAVLAFCEQYSIQPSDVMAVRGPSLGPSEAQFINFDEEWGAEWKKWFTPESKTMDLWQLTKHQLRLAGIPENQIFGLDLCTKTLEDEFYSYRRDKLTGRQAAIIWIEQGF